VRKREKEGGGEERERMHSGMHGVVRASMLSRSFTSDFRPPYKAMVLFVYFSCTSCLFVDASQSRISGRKREMQMEQ